MNLSLRLVGVLGVAACAACGDGPGDDPNDNRIQNPLHKGQTDRGDTYIQDNPAYEVAGATADNPTYFAGGNDIPEVAGAGNQGVNPLFKGSVTQEDLALARHEYTLHGTDADLYRWLVVGDIIMEKGEAGGLTYAVVRTTSVRDVPASLVP